MINLDPSAIDDLAESATEITLGIFKNVPIVGNVAICADSVCTTDRTDINFYWSPNPVAKVFFGASVLCGAMGVTSLGKALVTSFTSIIITRWLVSFGARGFNRLDKYALHMGNVIIGNITNATDSAELMS